MSLSSPLSPGMSPRGALSSRKWKWLEPPRGALAGIAGMILAARTGSALPQAGVAYELDAIAAVVIGGTSLAGGVGRVTGTVIGALLIGVMNNGLDLLGVESYYQQVIKGGLIVAAVMLDRSRRTEE